MKKGMQIKRLFSACCVVVLSACGGGGRSTQASGNAGASSQLSGTVAVGAPMLNATVTVLGANGQSVSTTATDSGSYAGLDVSALTPPYRIQACGLANGQSTCYYAFVQSGGVANVTPLTAANAATNLCAYASGNGFLGGKVANPALRSCDFSGSDKICTVGFDVINGTLSVESAEMAVVLRQGSATWALLGEENPYGINAGAAVQRTLRVGAGGSQPAYSRNLSIDVPTTVGRNATAPHAAKVYAHDAAGNWDLSTPIATLSDSGCAGQPNLTITGYSCGGEWLSLDRYNTTTLANGDALIDAFYRRGRDLRVDLYSDSAATTKYASVVVRIHGVPPKSADLPGVPWLDVDAASQSALAAYDSGTSVSKTLGVSWASNPAVIAHDLTLCADSACGTKVHASLPGSSSQTRATMNLASVNVSAAGYKRLTLYGRDRDEVGYESAYLSCQTGSTGCQ